MGIICKGECERYKVSKINGIGRYSLGLKRCNVCEIFVNWVGQRCPCCGNTLRTNPRKTRLKENLMVIRNTKRI